MGCLRYPNKFHKKNFQNLIKLLPNNQQKIHQKIILYQKSNRKIFPNNRTIKLKLPRIPNIAGAYTTQHKKNFLHKIYLFKNVCQKNTRPSIRKSGTIYRSKYVLYVSTVYYTMYFISQKNFLLCKKFCSFHTISNFHSFFLSLSNIKNSF